MELDGTTFEGSNKPSGPPTGSCCWFNRGVLNDSLRMGVDGPAQLFVTGCWKIGENFPAFTHIIVTGTDIYSMERLPLEGS